MRASRWFALSLLSLVACYSMRPSLLAPIGVSGASVIPRGEVLLSDLNCVACHAAESVLLERLQPKAAPNLERVGARRTPEWLESFLSDPQATEPGTTMPDLLVAFDGIEREEIVRSLVHFLASREGPLDISPRAASADALERGRQLFHRVGCVACHEPFESAYWLEESYWDLEARGVGDEEEVQVDEEMYVASGTLPAPAIPIRGLASKTNLDELTRFLLDPLSERPSGRMPSLGLEADEARDIAVYLLREQAVGTRVVPGISYEYFEGKAQRLADIAELASVREGSVDDFGQLPEHRDNQFAFRFSCFLDVPVDGSINSRLGRTTAPISSWMANSSWTTTGSTRPGRSRAWWSSRRADTRSRSRSSRPEVARNSR